MNFSVTAVLPENQINAKKSYFDLQMQPGQVQTLEVEMKNDTDESVTVAVSPNTAVTNDNGIAEYGLENPTLDKTLQYPFATLAKTEKEVVLAPHTVKVQKITITMPTESYDGIIVGGIHFQEKIDASKEKEEQSNVQIKNRFAYVIGVSLKETDTAVVPKMSLNAVKPAQVNFRNVVTANLQNTEAVIIPNLKVEGKIYTEKGKDVLFETTKENMRMVPNSNFNYAINWQDKEFQPGKYRLEMKADSGENHWKWTKYFTIDAKEAKEYNKKAVNLKKDPTKLYIWIGILLFILIILILLFLLWRSRKKEKESKEKLLAQAKRELLRELKKKDGKNAK